MLIIRIAVLAVVGGVLSLSLKKDQPAFAFLLSVAGTAALLLGIAGQMRPLLGYLQALAGSGQTQSIQCLVRVLGIALAAQFAADTCRDAGMQAAAAGAELCGRVLALAQALPLLQTLVDTLLSLLQ